eukprot:symbB.v1.2.041512.t1/scaffold8304.1/size6890/1
MKRSRLQLVWPPHMTSFRAFLRDMMLGWKWNGSGRVDG